LSKYNRFHSGHIFLDAGGRWWRIQWYDNLDKKSLVSIGYESKERAEAGYREVWNNNIKALKANDTRNNKPPAKPIDILTESPKRAGRHLPDLRAQAANNRVNARGRIVVSVDAFDRKWAEGIKRWFPEAENG
jgi:hypothetical protein